MRVLVTGVSGMVGSNLAAAAAQQSWRVLGTWHATPVQLAGARTSRLDMADRHACVALTEDFEPDVVVHAAASVALSRLERDPGLARLNVIGAENTLAAAHAVRARYVLVSSDWVFSGRRPLAQCWDEHDPTEPVNAYGRSKLACEQAVERSGGGWLITRPANVYGVNLTTPVERRERAWAGASTEAAAALRLARARHVWERSSLALRWVAQLRSGRPLPAPLEVHQSATYAWDYAQRVCELIAQECEGIFNTAGPDALDRHAYLRLLARVFDCDPELVHAAGAGAFLRACGEDPDLPLPFNTALCDAQASFVLGRPAIDPLAGLRLMREQLRRVLADRQGANHSIEEVHR
jgi:nucleoside-diphosphate-sugar epimerase